MSSQSARLYHAPVIFIGGLYLYATSLISARIPLWHDEIVSYYVARMDGPGAIIHGLMSKADNHPPLDYITRHYFLTLFGDSALAFRMPSILAMLAAAICLYVIVLRRASVLAALVAFSLPFGTSVLQFAHEGRSYALLIASMALVFLAWQFATEKPSIPRLILLTLALAVGPFLHYYGVFNFLPIALGEAWRSWERRKICWPIVFSGALAVALLGLLVPFALNASEFSAHFWSGLAPTAPFNAFYWLIGAAMPAFMASLILYSAATILPAATSRPTADYRPVPAHEIAAALMLSLLPFTTYVLAVLVTHAYASRYLLNAMLGIALLLAFLTARVERIRRLYGVILAVSFGLWAVGSLLNSAMKAPSKSFTLENSVVRTIETATLPVVIPNFNRFLVTYFYLPEKLKDRIYYPLNRGLDPQNGNSDTIGRAFLNLQPFVPINVPEFCAFVAQHPSFLILTGGNGWLYDKLSDDGATLSVISGKYPDNAVLSVTLDSANKC